MEGLKWINRHQKCLKKMTHLEKSLKETQTRLNFICRWVHNKFQGDESFPSSLINLSVNTLNLLPPQTDDFRNKKSGSSSESTCTTEANSPQIHQILIPEQSFIVLGPLLQDGQSNVQLSSLQQPVSLPQDASNAELDVKIEAETLEELPRLAEENRINNEDNSNLVFVGICSICHEMFCSSKLLRQHEMSHCYVKLDRIDISSFQKFRKKISSFKKPNQLKSKSSKNVPKIKISNKIFADENTTKSRSKSKNNSDSSKESSDDKIKDSKTKVKYKHKDRRGVFTCVYCPIITFTYASTLKRHEATYHKDKTAEIEKRNLEEIRLKREQKILEKISKKKPTRKYIRTSNNKPKKTKASLTTNDSTKVRRRTYNLHGLLGNNECCYCHKKFIYQEAMNRHKLKFHMDELTEQDRIRLVEEPKLRRLKKLSKLNAEALEGVQNSSLKSRAKKPALEEIEKNYACNRCERKFIVKATLNKHLVNYHLKELTAEERVRLVDRPREIRLKILENKTIVKTRKYKKRISEDEFFCAYCNKGFRMERKKKNHELKAHVNELTLQDQETLRRREKRRYGELNFLYECSYCKSTFIRLQHLRSHLDKAHAPQLSEPERMSLTSQLETYYSNDNYFYEQESVGEDGKVVTNKVHFKVNLPCKLCARETVFFKQTIVFARHLRNIHKLSLPSIKEQLFLGEFRCRFEECSKIVLGGKMSFVAHMLANHFKELSSSEKDENLNLIHKITHEEMTAKEERDRSRYTVSNTVQVICHESGCKTEFMRPQRLATHLIDVHNYSISEANESSGIMNYSCNYCIRVYNSHSRYVKHLASVHADVLTNEEKQDVETFTEKMYICVDCKKSWTRFEQYKSHFKLLHLDKYDAEFGPGGKYEKEETESDKRNKTYMVKCDQCDAIISSSSLKKHKFNMHEKVLKRFKCPQEGCEYRSNYMNRILEHSGIHSNVMKFKCTYCPYVSKTNYALNAHVKYNCVKFKDSKVKSFFCDQCGAGFYTSYNVKKHIKQVHENYRPFACEICSTRFKTSASLKYHVNTHNNPSARKRSLNKERLYTPKRVKTSNKTSEKVDKDTDESYLDNILNNF